MWKRTPEQDTRDRINPDPFSKQSNFNFPFLPEKKHSSSSEWIIRGATRVFQGQVLSFLAQKTQFLLPFSRREEKKYFKFQNTYIFYAREISGKGKGDFRWKEEEEKKNGCGTNEGGRGDMRQLYFRRRKEGRSNLQLFEKKVFIFPFFCTRKQRRRHSTFAATENRKRWRRGKRHGKRRKIWGEALKSFLPPTPYLRKIVFHYSPPSFFVPLLFPHTQKKPGWIACELIWWLHTRFHTCSFFFNAI